MLKVELGNTGLFISKLALGTGTHGWNHESEQTRRGFDWLVEHLKIGYDLGVNFWDLADQYGSHKHAREALNSIDREKIVINTKTTAQNYKDGSKAVKKFLKELNTDYLDIVLLHAKSSSNWNIRFRPVMDALSEAKEKGLVKAVGISSHGLDGLKTAASESWVDVILVRLNYESMRMDASKEQVIPILKDAHRRGKGIYAMKVLGCGPLSSNPEKGIKYILDLDFIDAMTIGHTENDQLKQNVEIIHRLDRS